MKDIIRVAAILSVLSSAIALALLTPLSISRNSTSSVTDLTARNTHSSASYGLAADSISCRNVWEKINRPLSPEVFR